MELQFDLKGNNFSELVKKIIHDLRSPLMVLYMICGSSKDLSERDKIVLENVAGRMDRIIESMNKKTIEIDTPEINTAEVIKKILQEKEIEYVKSNVQFIYEQDKSLENVTIEGNIGDFERMISNLLNNAVEACHGKAGIIMISLGYYSSKLHLTISDNGAGIPDEVLQKLKHGEMVTYGKQNGRGLGFMQIRKTLDELNGAFNIESKIGVGSKLYLTFG